MIRALGRAAAVSMLSAAAYAGAFSLVFARASSPLALAWAPAMAAAMVAVAVGGVGGRRVVDRSCAAVVAAVAMGAAAWLTGWLSPAPIITPMPATAADGFVATSDGALYFHQTAVAGSTRPVVLVLHGGPGSGSISLRAALEPALGPAVRAIFFDQRGVGRSSAVRSFGLDDYLDDIERLRVALHVDSWFLVGASWGAALADEYALRHSSRVRGIVTWGGLLSAQASTASILRRLEAFYQSHGDADGAEWCRSLLAQTKPYTRIQTIRVMNAVNRSRLKTVLSPADEAGMVRAARQTAITEWGYTAREAGGGLWATAATYVQAGLENYDFDQRLAALKTPMLVLAGDRDPLLASSGIADALAAAPLASLHWMPGLGHTVDDPPAFAREILAFVAAHSEP